MAISSVLEKVLQHLYHITAEPVQAFTLSICLSLICLTAIHVLLISLQEEEMALSKVLMRTHSRISKAIRTITPFISLVEKDDAADLLRSTANEASAAAFCVVTPELINNICLTPTGADNTTVTEDEKGTEDSGLVMVAGLTNTGNSCFLNSVLQSLSSLPKLQAYLHQFSRSTATMSTTSSIPITRSLLKTLLSLTKPSPENKFFQPKEIVAALSISNDIINREQQDAQELYQLLMSELDTEITQAKKRRLWKNGFKDILQFMAAQPAALSTYHCSSDSQKKQPDDEFIHLENPLNGLLAYKMTCTECGSMSGIPLQLFNNLQLTLPNDKDHTSLNDCLEQLTSVEYLQDVECQQCTLRYHQKSTTTDFKSPNINANEELNILQPSIPPPPTPIIKTEKAKQAMFVKPPKILCLHFVRSMYLYTGEIRKNTCKVDFPELLDLTPYCNTTFHNSTFDTNLSKNATKLPLTPPPTPPTAKNYTYRLMSMVVHYGDHYSGHYIAYKRRIVAKSCSCKTCQQEQMTLRPSQYSEWYRISDDNVRLCQAEDALNENPFMLMYELVENDEEEAALPFTGPYLSYTHPIQNDILEHKEEDEEEMAELVSDTSSRSSSSSEDEESDDELYQRLPAAPPSSPSLKPIFNKPQKKHSLASPPASTTAHPFVATNTSYNIVHTRERRLSSISTNNVPLTECRSIPIIIQ